MKRDVIKLLSKYTVEEQQPTTNRRYSPPEYGTRLVNKSVDKSYLARVEKILLVDKALNYVMKELHIQPVGWAETRKQQVRENPSPIHTVKPLYPRRAQMRGIQGHAVVEFDIAENGTVKYPRVHVASPPGVFNRAAINAVSKYRYDPLIVNLEPFEVENGGLRSKPLVRSERR